MRPLGITFIIGGIFFCALSIFSFVQKATDRIPEMPMTVKSEDGQGMSLLPLLGIISFATGGALVVASVVTKQSK